MLTSLPFFDKASVKKANIYIYIYIYIYYIFQNTVSDFIISLVIKIPGIILEVEELLLGMKWFFSFPGVKVYLC